MNSACTFIINEWLSILKTLFHTPNKNKQNDKNSSPDFWQSFADECQPDLLCTYYGIVFKEILYLIHSNDV